MLDLKLDEPARAALRREMCGEPSDTPVAVERRDNKIVLSSHAHATKASLQARLTSYREEYLKRLEASILWQERKNHVDTLSGQLIDALRASKQRVSREDTLAILETLLTEARQQGADTLDLKRTIARAILARAMLVTFATSDSEHCEDAHAATIIDAVAERLKRIEVGASNFRIARSVWELLLTFEQRFPDAAGDRVHEAILSTGRRGLLREGTEPLWMYVRSVSVIYTPATPEQLGPSSRIAFFRSPTTVRILRKKAETAELTSALVWVRSREPLTDTDWLQINKALGELWATSYAVAG